MVTSTLGITLDEATRDRLEDAARRIERPPQWVIEEALLRYLEEVERAAEIVSRR